VPYFYRKTTHEDKYYGPRPITAGLGLTPLKTKAKGQAPEPLALLRFARPLSISSDPRDIIQAPEPYDDIKTLDPFAQLLLRSTPYCNTLPQARTVPYLFPAKEQELAASCRIAWELVTPDSWSGQGFHGSSSPPRSNREKLRYAAPYHVHLNGTGSNGRLGPPPFRRRSFRTTKSSSSWHHVRVWPRRVNCDTSTATACHHYDDDCTNARTKRKGNNREHLRAFSFYFRTFRYCNPTPPFAYYKRGGRDPQQKRLDNAQQWKCTKHTLKHLNTPTHRILGAIPLSISLYPSTTSTSVQSNISSSKHWK
jgi:hypothetical protein